MCRSQKAIQILLCAVLSTMDVIFPLSCTAEGHSILLYALGSDLEADSGALTDDLMEIVRATKDEPVQVVAFLGGSSFWWFPGLRNGCCYEISATNGETEILREYTSCEGGNSECFSSFLKTYAKDGDDLILWGHGLSGFRGLGFDALNGKDCLTLAEITAGLEKSGVHFRLFGFDACTMGTLEAAWLAAPYADYFAASTGTENITGWNYHDVVRLISAMDSNLPERLKEAFATANRDPMDTHLILVDETELLELAPFLSLVFDSSDAAVLPAHLADLAGSCLDREVGEQVVRVPGICDLIVSGFEGDCSADAVLPLPGIEDSYRSFVDRK